MPFASNLPPKDIHKAKMLTACDALRKGVRLKELPGITGLTQTQCQCVLENWIAREYVEYDFDCKTYKMLVTPPSPPPNIAVVPGSGELA
jgi:hypothetical protein